MTGINWKENYEYWHPSALVNEHGSYRIIAGGVLNKKDCSLLFESGEATLYLPAENTEQLSFFDDVSLGSGTIKLFAEKGISCSFYNQYGNLLGKFIPETGMATVETMIMQACVYKNSEIRLAQAKELEKVMMYHLVKMMKYFTSKTGEDVLGEAAEIEKCVDRISMAESIDELLLTEARARQVYYDVLGQVISKTEFEFNGRSKRPPLDEVNAMISFGNTILYGDILKMLKNEGLDERIGVIHSLNRRLTSLNLDFADIYKPIAVDRVIISMIKKHKIKKSHFEPANGGIYMTAEGKKMFAEEYKNAMNRPVKIQGVKTSLKTFISKQIKGYKENITEERIFSPGKVY